MNAGVIAGALVAARAGRAAAGGLTPEELHGALPAGVAYSGYSPLAGYTFDDKNGTNYVLFSHTSTTGGAGPEGEPMTGDTLFIDHVAVKGKARPRVVRKVRELVEPCPYSLTSSFHDAAFGVTDLDKDGYGEITFAYEVGCRSDVRPDTYKLLLLENGAKYILRGLTRIESGGDDQGAGSYTADPVEKKWPKAFLEHAQTLWENTADDGQIPPGINGQPPGDGGGGGNPCGG